MYIDQCNNSMKLCILDYLKFWYVYYTYIIPFNIEMREINGDSPLWRS